MCACLSEERSELNIKKKIHPLAETLPAKF